MVDFPSPLNGMLLLCSALSCYICQALTYLPSRPDFLTGTVYT